MDLQQCRDKIDTIDEKIFNLLSQRFETTKNVIEYKIENNLEIYQKNREDEVISKVKSLCEKNNINSEFGAELITLIMKESKRLQQDILKSVNK